MCFAFKTLYWSVTEPTISHLLHHRYPAECWRKQTTTMTYWITFRWSSKHHICRSFDQLYFLFYNCVAIDNGAEQCCIWGLLIAVLQIEISVRFYIKICIHNMSCHPKLRRHSLTNSTVEIHWYRNAYRNVILSWRYDLEITGSEVRICNWYHFLWLYRLIFGFSWISQAMSEYSRNIFSNKIAIHIWRIITASRSSYSTKIP